MEEEGREGVREGVEREHTGREEKGEREERRVCVVVARATSGQPWLELAGSSGKGDHPQWLPPRGSWTTEHHCDLFC